MLVIASVLLPSGTQTRWITEWAGELATITTSRGRLWFAATLLLAMPRLARTLRRPAGRSESRHPVGTTIVSGTSLVAVTNTNTAWAAATVALGLLILIATILLVNSDAPARRIREIIETWRNRPPR